MIDSGSFYYTVLPIVSIVIPQPITTGMIAFTDCNEFDNCDEGYRDLYILHMHKVGILGKKWGFLR